MYFFPFLMIFSSCRSVIHHNSQLWLRHLVKTKQRILYQSHEPHISFMWYVLTSSTTFSYEGVCSFVTEIVNFSSKKTLKMELPVSKPCSICLGYISFLLETFSEGVSSQLNKAWKLDNLASVSFFSRYMVEKGICTLCRWLAFFGCPVGCSWHSC